MTYRRLLRTLSLVIALLTLASRAMSADVLVPINSIAPANEKIFVISIGVDRYADSFWPALKWAATDAQRVAAQFGTGAAGTVVRHVLVNDAANAESIRATLASVAAEARSNDAVILYISAHGTLAQTGAGDLERVVVTHDTQKDQPLTTGLTQATLSAWLDKVAARKKLMMFATCYSGEGKSRLPEGVRALLGTAKGKLVSLADVSEGALVLAAAAKNEAALEDDRLQGDIYTHFVLEALTTYDRNKDGMVSALEAHDYARDRTWQYTQGRQRPTANARFIGDADLALFGRKTATGLPVLEAYDERLAGFRVEFAGGNKGEVPTAFPLNAKGDVITVFGPGSTTALGSYRVRAKAGDTVDLEDVLLHRPWSVGGGWRHTAWSASAWEDVVGAASVDQYMLTGGANRGRWGARLMLPLVVDMNHSLRTALDTNSTLTAAGVGVEYRVPTANWAWSVTGELWREQLKIEFADAVTNDRESFSATSTSIALGAGAERRWFSDVWLMGRVGWRNGQWDFDRIGALNGNAYWLQLGLEYRFGGKARTL